MMNDAVERGTSMGERGMHDVETGELVRCPWCETIVKDYHFYVERDDGVWHDRCLWAKEHGLEKGWTLG